MPDETKIVKKLLTIQIFSDIIKIRSETAEAVSLEKINWRKAIMKFTWEDFEKFWQELWKNICLFFSHFGYETPLEPEEPCTND